jgi:predicted nucleotidyltransferase component of viral defense system
MLHYETITDPMKKIAEVIFNDFDTDFFLAGGTALALQIGHRSSIDLDYFIQADFDTQKLKQSIFDTFKSQTKEIVFEEKNTLWCIIDGVKISFITRKDPLQKDIIVADFFRLASIEDITVMKLNAVCSRDEFKDYFDLACISNITDVRSWGVWWNEVYPHTDLTSWLVALGSVDTVPKIPLEIQEKFKTLNVPNRIKAVVMEITNFLR